MDMERELCYFVLADALSCWKLFGSKSQLIMRRTSCRIVVANFIAKKCGIVLPDRVEVVDFDILQMEKLSALQKRFAPGLAIGDAASLFLAKDKNMTLIVENGLLHRCANELHINSISCKAFAEQVARLEADGAPPVKLTEERMKKIKVKEVHDPHRNKNHKLKNNNYE